MPGLAIFTAAELEQHFKQKLTTLVNNRQVGSYILALANALTNSNLYQQLDQDLQTALHNLKQQAVNAPDDDLQVFSQLIEPKTPFPSLAENKRVGVWQVSLNPIRAYRPARNAQQKINSIYKPFDQNAFHFNKPFLQKEMLAEIHYQNKKIKLFFNKFPFSKFHLLLLLEPEKQQAQLLNRDSLSYMSHLAEQIDDKTHYQYLAYNAIGAFASVNHLHFHYNLLDYPLPIFDPQWQHNGGNKAYPLRVYVFNNASDAWHFIDELHQQDICYNLILHKNKILVIPRKFQGDYPVSSWLQNIAWFELSGVFTLADSKQFELIRENTLFTELEKLRLPII